MSEVMLLPFFLSVCLWTFTSNFFMKHFSFLIFLLLNVRFISAALFVIAYFIVLGSTHEYFCKVLSTYLSTFIKRVLSTYSSTLKTTSTQYLLQYFSSVLASCLQSRHSCPVSINQLFLDTLSDIRCKQNVDLSDFPTRIDNTIDVFDTNRLSLTEQCVSLPRINDHDFVVVVVLFYVHGKVLWSCLDSQLT